MPAATNREFFAVRTVAEALAGFQPGRRTAPETVDLAGALHRVPAGTVLADEDLPAFPRATVDGYAVRAADTFGASEVVPAYLEVVGAVRMGVAPDRALSAGSAMTVPTGGALPPGADAVAMLEHTATATGSTIEMTRPVAPGDGVVGAGEDARPGASLVTPGRPLRAHDLGMLASAGITRIAVCGRPRVTIVATGDEVVTPSTAPLPAFRVRDATSTALAALVAEAGGVAQVAGIVPDDADALDAALRSALPGCDVLVVSAGSSVGARDMTAAVIAGLGEPGIWCHGLALRPGKPALLAQCGDVPVMGLPGNPRSALTVFRLIGMAVVRRVGGMTHPPPEPVVRARLAADLPSVAGRLDVVQVRVCDGEAEPRFGRSALLSVLTGADGWITVPEAVTGLAAGTDVDVTLYR